MLWLLIAAGFLIPKSDNILVNTLRYIFIVIGILGVMGLGLGGGIFSFRQAGLNPSSIFASRAGFANAVIAAVFAVLGAYIVKILWRSSWQEFAIGAAMLILLIFPAAEMLMNVVIAFAASAETGITFRLPQGQIIDAYITSAVGAGLQLLLVAVANAIYRNVRRSKRNESSTQIRGASPNVSGDKMSDSATGQTRFSRSADGAKESESSNVIRGALPNVNNNKMSDLVTDQPRFSRSAAGVITDSVTNLQWLPGPDQDTDYEQAEQWVASQTVAGGGWRMPTRQELKTLYDPSCQFHIPSSFKAMGMRWVWAEPRDSTSAWDFNFDDGGENWDDRNISGDVRVFAVRADPRSLPSYGSLSLDSDGVITDSVTNLQWLPGPNRDTNYSQAEQWVASQTTSGGGWRMPTKEELKTLYDPSCEFHISPLFNATGKRWVWAEPHSSSSAWHLRFDDGSDYWYLRGNSYDGRVFAVRARK